MSVLTDIFQSASNGILPIYENTLAFVFFVFFIIWAAIQDLKTMKVKDYQNLSFFLVGLVLFGNAALGGIETGFTLGTGHVYGAIVGFLLLFIPGMILNYAFGGDIKFVTVMGFWVGPAAITLILFVATLIQLLILVGRVIFTKNFSMKSNLPFAPAFAVGYFILLGALMIL